MPPRKRRVRGHIEQLPSGSYRSIVYRGIDAITGKPRQLREVAKTHTDAEKALTELQRQVDEDKHPKSNPTVRQVVEQWLEDAELEDTTRERYDYPIRLYVRPTLVYYGHSPLEAIPRESATSYRVDRLPPTTSSA